MRKIFSLLAAVLFAGSMMAQVTILPTDFTATTEADYSVTKDGVTVAVVASTVTNDQMRIFKGKTITISAESNISSIVFTCTANGTAKYGPGCFNAQEGYTFEADGKTGTWTGSATSVTFTAESNQVRATQIVVTLAEGGEPVEPGDEPVAEASVVYDWAGNIGTTIFGGNSNITTGTVKIHENTDDVNGIKFGSSYVYADGKYIAIKPAEGAFKAGDTLKVSVVFNNSDLTKYCMASVYAADGETLMFRSDSATTLNGRLSTAEPAVQEYILASDQDSLLIGRYGNTGMFVPFLQVVRPAASDEPVVEGPKNLGAKTIAEFLELKNTTDTCILTGVVSNIQNTTYGNFDLTDESGTVYVYGLLTPAGETKKFADLNVAENDTLTVLAIYNEYNSTPQAKNAIFVEVKKSTAPVVEPVNLGAKTIAEFLELKNTKDTCILTGVVSNIQNTTYGNFDLTDESGTVYVYGLLTPAGETKKFADLNVAENDTLTVLAIYNEYNNAPQAKNAVFVEVKKYVEPVVFSHELYGSEALPVIDKTYFATGDGWAADADSHAEIVNDYDINLVLVASKASAWQSQVFVNPGFAWEVGAYYKMEFDLTTNHQLGGVHVKVNDDNTNFFYDSYPNDNIFLANQTTHYVADSIYAVAEPTNGGQLIFSVGWCDANTEILISNIVITKYEAPVVAQDINITLSSIENPGSLIWTDATADEGWWQIMGGSDSYGFSLSNAGEIAEAAGTYTVADLDADYSYISLYGATDTVDVAFVDGSVTVAVSAEGIVTVNGTLVGDDGNNYIFNLTYKDPVAEKTVELNIPAAELYDGYAAYGLYGVYGYTADNTSYVQLGIWTEEFQGDFTEDDLDYQYIGSGLIDADGTQSIFSAAITVTPGNGEGVYRITADLLCYNNTLYKVTMQIGVEQGIEDVDAAVKAIKTIKNGQLIIEKNGVQYNAQGAVIR